MLTQTVGYALTALGFLALREGQPALVREVAQATGIPHDYLAKVIHTLARKGFVSTQRGKGGGVSLARDPASVSLYEVCVALDDPIVMERCMLGTALCSDERSCPCHAFWSVARRRVTDFLKKKTLQDMASFQKRENKRLGLPAGGD